MADRLSEVRDFVRDVDPNLHRSFEFEVDNVRDSKAGDGSYTMVGHAAVFNRWSLDLGGFRERIKKGAFDEVLSRDPHVVHVIDHDTRMILSSTRSKSLDLSIDPKGLRYWSRVAPTSYAADLRILLERGDISQSSFAFTVAKDEWKIRDEEGDEIVERTIIEVGDLYDVTTCAMGAYPATDADLALRSLISGRGTSFALPTPVAPAREDEDPAAHVEAGEPQPEANGSASRQWSIASRSLLELRADMETLPALLCMYQLGQEFIEDEDQPEDEADRQAMQQILDQLEALVEAEATEPAEADDSAARTKSLADMKDEIKAEQRRVRERVNRVEGASR